MIATHKGDFDHSSRHAWLMTWVVLTTLSACTFEPPPAVPGLPPGVPIPNETTTPISPIVDSGEDKVFEEPDAMVVYRGFACAESNEPDFQNILRVQRSRDIPATLNAATVLLNGWRFRYLNGDHKLMGLGTGIFKIRRKNDKLIWEAWGGISDGNFDDPYRWCYNYALVAWNRAVFAANPDDRDIHAFEGDNAARWHTALQFFTPRTSRAIRRARRSCRGASASCGKTSMTVTCSSWPTTSITPSISWRAIKST